MGYPRIAAKVYAFLKANPQKEFTALEIAKATESSDGGVRNACRLMKKKGKAIKESVLSAHNIVYSYTRAPHNSSPKRNATAVDGAVQVTAAAAPAATVKEVTLTIPVLGGQVQMTLQEARKLHADLDALFRHSDQTAS
jgi:hypothetical protein